MLRTLRPIHIAAFRLQVGDLEGLHPTSILFGRYPPRGIVLAASLALRGDSVTGVREIYTRCQVVSRVSKKILQRVLQT